MAVAEKWKGFSKLPVDIRIRLGQTETFWKRRENILLVYLFGSLLNQKTASPVNDVDFAILFNTRQLYCGLTELLEDLYKYLGTERIHVLDLSRATPVMKFDIVSSGKLLFSRNSDTLNRFEHRVIKEHMDTEYLRKIQLWYIKDKASKNA